MKTIIIWNEIIMIKIKPLSHEMKFDEVSRLRSKIKTKKYGKPALRSLLTSKCSCNLLFCYGKVKEELESEHSSCFQV